MEAHMFHAPLRLALMLLLLSPAISCNGGGSLEDDTADDDDTGDATPDPGPPELAGWCDDQDPEFSFFVTSMAALWALSGDDINDLEGGFGGNFGGLDGADAICQGIAAATGNGERTWRAFLSATDDGEGNPVHAIERIGDGPWSDANGRLVASGIEGLLADARPDGDEQTINDLPDECGVPLSALGDSHDVVTASGTDGMLFQDNLEATCNDWTTSDGSVGQSQGGGPGGGGGPLRCGHSFPRQSGGPGGNNGQQWLSDHPLRGCGKGANLIQNGPGEGNCIGCSGGYGALYCFSL